MTLRELARLDGRVYVHFSSNALAQQFMKQAEEEGFTFQDGVHPSERQPSDIIALNSDLTLNYVGLIGRIAIGAKAKNIGTQQLFLVEYPENKTL